METRHEKKLMTVSLARINELKNKTHHLSEIFCSMLVSIVNLLGSRIT